MVTYKMSISVCGMWICYRVVPFKLTHKSEVFQVFDLENWEETGPKPQHFIWKMWSKWVWEKPGLQSKFGLSKEMRVKGKNKSTHGVWEMWQQGAMKTHSTLAFRDDCLCHVNHICMRTPEKNYIRVLTLPWALVIDRSLPFVQPVSYDRQPGLHSAAVETVRQLGYS